MTPLALAQPPEEGTLDRPVTLPPPPTASTPDPVTWRLRTRSALWLDGDIDGTAGDIGRWNASADLRVSIPLEEGFRVSMTLNTGLTDYDFSGDTGLVPAGQAPWDRIISHSITLGLRKQDDRGIMFGGALFASDGEAGAPFEDTPSVGAVAGFMRDVSEDLSLGAVVAVQSRLEDDPLILPLPVVRWIPDFDPERRWQVRVGGAPGGPARVIGAGLEFEASETMTYSIGLAAVGLGAEFRLDDDTPVPNGVGRDQSFPLVLGFRWTPREGTEVVGFAGAAFLREIELQDRDGNTIGERDVDPSPVFGLTVSLTF